jgi:hypothetical protein
MRLTNVRPYGVREKNNPKNQWNGRLFFRPSCRGNFSPYFRRELSVAGQWQGKVMIAGRRSKTVAFVAILAALTFGALATASAQPADIKAIDKAFQDHYARGNYPAAEIDAQKLERLVKVRFGTSARARRLIVKRCSKGVAL